MTGRTIRLNPNDEVAVAIEPLAAGDRIDSGILVREPIPAGHKVALVAVEAGRQIHRYGQPIGIATAAIEPGRHVHTHNLSVEGVHRSDGGSEAAPAWRAPESAPRTFDGYLRADGRAGTRNYLAIVSTVNCSASVSRFIADRIRPELAAYPGIDGVIALTHPLGCTMPVDGEEHRQLERVLAGFADHPNVAASLVIGLGCEVAQVDRLFERHALAGRERINSLVIQDEGGARRTVEAGVAALRDLLPATAAATRTPLPASKLVLGLQCGGSDGYSGITANPALGFASDLLVAQGGTAVLAETPEIYGAEHLLARRAVSPRVREQLMERIRWWEAYAARHGASIDNNPTPGNKAGGLTTIFEKSLGAVAKAGSSPLAAVHLYAERIAGSGLALMDTPGNDPISMTGLVAGGANILAFTTGRGSVYGCKPSPSLKIATTSDLYRRLDEDMDIDAGVVLDGRSVEDVGRAIFEELLAVASGKPTKSEAQGIGDEEFAPWHLGPMF
jgi:altronate hydrolase